ncbi:MAG: hypothetical protein PHY93_10060 [Bacteriovorax sp.]|nr:hypothetical protein [Bacteriovorax sp.]
MNQDGIWLSILDYATARKTSISTIRRSIKAGHVKFREENGKYFIWTKEIKNDYSEEKKELAIKLELEFLKKQHRELIEEVNDLKMLLNVYEDQHRVDLPPIPEIEL